MNTEPKKQKKNDTLQRGEERIPRLERLASGERWANCKARLTGRAKAKRDGAPVESAAERKPRERERTEEYQNQGPNTGPRRRREARAARRGVRRA